MKRRIGIGLALGLVLVLVGFATLQKETLLREGHVMLLELAPVDPRSLMQGDYMALRYAMVAAQSARGLPIDGRFVVRVGEDGVATFVRRDTGAALAADERRIRYRVRNGAIQLGAEAFFFQEGRAERYARAKYGELRVDDDGESLLVGLRDGRRRRLR